MTKTTNINSVSKKTFLKHLAKIGSSMMIPVSLLAFGMLINGIALSFSEMESMKTFQEFLLALSSVLINNFPLFVALSITISYLNNKGTAVLNTLIMYLSFQVIQFIFIKEQDNGKFQILFYEDLSSSLFTTSLGMKCLNTSIFGSLVIAFSSIFVYKRFEKTKLPQALTFFSGVKTPMILSTLIGSALGMIILMVYPLLGMGIENLGILILSLPYGVDTFIYGFLNRLLLPFGLHTILMTTFNTTSVTGVLTQNGQVIATGDYNIWHKAYELNIPFNLLQEGGSFTWEGNTYTITENVNPGQYTQGFYPIMIFAFPAAGIAMSLKSKEKSRWTKYFLISLIPMLCGVTETFEYLFIFTYPILYFFHALLTGFSFMFMDLLHCSIGMSIGWIIDPFIFGLVPQLNGNVTNIQWLPVVGIVFSVLYFALFSIFWKEKKTELKVYY